MYRCNGQPAITAIHDHGFCARTEPAEDAWRFSTVIARWHVGTVEDLLTILSRCRPRIELFTLPPRLGWCSAAREAWQNPSRSDRRGCIGEDIADSSHERKDLKLCSSVGSWVYWAELVSNLTDMRRAGCSKTAGAQLWQHCSKKCFVRNFVTLCIYCLETTEERRSRNK